MSGQANAITRAPTRAPEESLSPLNEIALQNPIPEQNETFTSRHWQVISGGAGVCALGTAILSGFHLSPALEYLTPIAVGIFAHIAFELATPRRISKPVDNWLAGYALTEFLLLTLLYLNLYDFFDPGHDSGNHVLDKAGQWILGFMLAGGGTWVSVKAFKIAQKPKSDDARLPLINTDIQRLRAFCSSDTAAYGIKIGFQASTGITFIALGATFSNGYAIDIGSFVLGDVGGQALEKMLHELDQHLKGRRGEKAWAVIHKLFDILGRNFLGPLFVANHPAAYATIGALYGKSRSTVYRRFGESDLRRIKDFPPRTTCQRVALAVKWTLATASGAAAVTVVALPKVSFPNKLIAGSFTPAAFTSYFATIGVSHLVRRFREHGSLKDLAYFLMHIDPMWITLAYLYINQKMPIGDEALNDANVITLAFAAFAWVSLGGTLGNELGQEAKTVIISPAAEALFWNFVTQSIKQAAT